MRVLMLTIVFVVALVTGPGEPVPFAAPNGQQGVDASNRGVVSAIDRGLEFLHRSQQPDGSWPSKFGNPFSNPWGTPQAGGRNVVRPQGDLAVTSLAIMAFLSAGHVPGEGPYGESLETAINWVLDNQQKDGKICPLNGTEMYYHGIGTLMLAEAVGLTKVGTAERVRDGLQRAVKVILAAQRQGGERFSQANMAGGWRYSVNDGGLQGSDLSVTGWQLMALRAAKNVGCDVPVRHIDAAVEYVKRSFEPRNGGFQYQPGGPITVPCTGVGVLCLELSGKDYHLCDEALGGGAYILKNSSRNQNHFYYGLYYMSQAMFQLGGNYWDGYRPKLHKTLLELSPPERDGSWMLTGDGAMYGSSYSTAMAVLALTVEYRYLPIYQRFEEPLERDGRE